MAQKGVIHDDIDVTWQLLDGDDIQMKGHNCDAAEFLHKLFRLIHRIKVR